jgi:hypothetical protein
MPATAADPVTRPAPDAAPASVGSVQWHCVAMCAGVLLIAVADALARTGHGALTPLFWLGEITLFLPMVLIVVTRTLTARQFLGSVATFAVATASTRWLYSPSRFAFPDELQHLVSTENLLAQGRFGIPNPALPIGADYPGLDVVGAVLARCAGLSVEHAGILLGALCHVATMLLVAALLARVLPTLRLAALGMVVYACNPGAARFMAFYVYENLALVYGTFAVVCTIALRSASGRRRVALTATAVAASLATVFTHHVTSLILPAALLAVVAWTKVRPPAQPVLRPVAAIFAVSCLLTIGWIVAVARGTWEYLKPYTVDLGARTQVQRLVPHRGEGAVIPFDDSTPLWETALGGLSFLTVFLLCGGAALAAWRRGRRPEALLPAVAALGLVFLAGARVLSGRGSELTGRSGPYLYVPVAIGAALCLGDLLRRVGRTGRSVVAAGLVVVLVGGVCISWPVWWERLPGGSLVATVFERGVDERSVAAAQWLEAHTAPSSRVAGDVNALVEIGTRAHRNAVSGLADVFYERTIDARVIGELRSNRVDYIWVNRRLTHTPSSNGVYYGTSGYLYTTAPTAAALHKFDDAPGVQCVFDNGEIGLYDVRAVAAP